VAVETGFNMLYHQGLAFYHGLIEWMPQFYVYAQFFKDNPGIPLLGHKQQVGALYGTVTVTVTVSYSTVLYFHYTALHCTAMQCAVLHCHCHCTVLLLTVLYSTLTLCCTVLRCCPPWQWHMYSSLWQRIVGVPVEAMNRVTLEKEEIFFVKRLFMVSGQRHLSL